MLKSAKNSIYDNCKNTYPCSAAFPVLTYNFSVIFRSIYAKTPCDDHYNFLSPELDGQLPLNFAR